MAFTANAIGRVRPSGVDTNGAFFDPSLLTLTDLAATSATGTAPVVTSASYTFVAGDVNAYVFVKSGTNWTPGWYLIASVSAGAATLTATIGSVRLYTGDYSTINTVAGCATTGSPTAGTFGVDYTQQNAAVAATSDYTSTASTTITSATAAFTVAMIGNAIRLSAGAGATTGYYFITAVASGTSLTVDRSSGTYTVGVGKVGGGALTFKRLMDSANATGDKVVAGNIVFMRGGGTDTPSSSDYADFTSFFTPVSGSASAGFVKLIGENGRPRVRGNGLILNGGTYVWLENLYFSTTSNSNGNLGFFSNGGTQGVYKNLTLNTANITGMSGLSVASHHHVIQCYITSGTSSPTASATSIGIVCTTHSNFIVGNRIEWMGGAGISAVDGNHIRENEIYGCLGDGIVVPSAGSAIGGHISDNVIDGNGGHGITFTVAALLTQYLVTGNIVSNQVGGSKYGLNVGAGTAAANDLLKRFVDYNVLYSNTANYNAISAGPNDTIGTDPQFVSRTTGDFTLGTNLKALGWPRTFRGGTGTNYKDPGPLQREEAGAGAGGGPLVSGRLVQ